MSARLSDDRFRELCTGYVLSALDDAERSDFLQELHRRGDEGLHALARVEEVVGHVGLAASPVEPPGRLRETLFSSLDIPRGSVPRPPPEEPPGPTLPSGPPEPPPGPPAEEGLPRPPGPTPVRGRDPGRRGLWMAAAAVLFVAAAGLATWAVQLQQRLEERDVALERARTELAEMDSLRARLEAARAAFRELASPATRALSLTGTGSLPGASARIYVDPQTGRALILADELPILPPDSVYQLWAIRGETPTSVGTFQLEDPGPARVPVEDPSTLEQADALAVTVEPAPGRPQPTGEIVLSSTL